MEIPQLKEKLIHVLGNYSLELELRQGCNTILTSDMAELYERLWARARRLTPRVKKKMAGIRLNPEDIHIMHKSEYSGMFGDYSSYSAEYDEIADAEGSEDEE